jgi:hypothetical protein
MNLTKLERERKNTFPHIDLDDDVKNDEMDK